MKKRFTEEQIIQVLKEHEVGAKTADVCRLHGIAEATFYNWKAKYGGMEASEAKRLKALEAENTKLKKLLAKAELDKAMMKELLRKKMSKPAEKRQAVSKVQNLFVASSRRAQRVVGLSRGIAQYKTKRNDGTLREALRRIAAERRRFGYKRLTVMLRREGHVHNLNKIYRIYRKEGLMVRQRKGRKRAVGTRSTLPKPDKLN